MKPSQGAQSEQQPEDPCAGGRCGAHGIGLIDIPFFLIGYGVGKYILGPIFGRIGGLFGSRAGEFAGQSVDDLARAASALDRSGLTAAGRALAKHGGRPGSAFPKPTGDAAEINRTAQKIVDGILRNRNSTAAVRQTGRFGQVTDVIGPDGRGLRFDSSGNFLGFLEP